MRTAQETSAINRMLMSHGLGRLEDGAGLMSQLGFLVEDHEHPSASTEIVSAGTRPQAPQTAVSDAPEIALDDIQQQKGHVVVELVRAKKATHSLTIPGRLAVNEDQTWHVGAVASGRIENISARVGDFVMAGQILGLLHSHEVHEPRQGIRSLSRSCGGHNRRRSIRSSGVTVRSAYSN